MVPPSKDDEGVLVVVCRGRFDPCVVGGGESRMCIRGDNNRERNHNMLLSHFEVQNESFDVFLEILWQRTDGESTRALLFLDGGRFTDTNVLIKFYGRILRYA